MLLTHTAPWVPIRRLGLAMALCLSMLLVPFTLHQSSAQDPTETDASVRFVHASPDAPAVDVIVGRRESHVRSGDRRSSRFSG